MTPNFLSEKLQLQQNLQGPRGNLVCMLSICIGQTAGCNIGIANGFDFLHAEVKGRLIKGTKRHSVCAG
jgi:hypothetical protein